MSQNSQAQMMPFNPNAGITPQPPFAQQNIMPINQPPLLIEPNPAQMGHAHGM
jgi:hypothetical protein